MLEPWGAARDDLRMGMVASAVLNVHRTKSTSPIFHPSQFIMRFGPEAQQKTKLLEGGDKDSVEAVEKARTSPLTKERFHALKTEMKALGEALRGMKGIPVSNP